MDDFEKTVDDLAVLINNSSSESEKKKYRQMYIDAVKKWDAAIAAAPKDSADIYFSDCLVL